MYGSYARDYGGVRRKLVVQSIHRSTKLILENGSSERKHPEFVLYADVGGGQMIITPNELLNVAVAECIYGWEYVGPTTDGRNWETFDGYKKTLGNWLWTFNALSLLEDMREIYGLYGDISVPFREGRSWWCKLSKIGTPTKFTAKGKTMEEAIVRCCLAAVGVHIDA
jgi:hypothetical protein